MIGVGCEGIGSFGSVECGTRHGHNDNQILLHGQSRSTMNGATPKLADQYPVNTLWTLTLADDTKINGRVYCTDENSQSVVIERPLTHTTLASEVKIINAAAIVNAEPQEEAENTTTSKPLPKIQKKQLEERERKALRQAEESFRHINQKASAHGQACFDRLLKACNEVVWKEESILVLNHVQVDPPYTPESCSLVQRGGRKALDDGSLERVKKIVAAAAAAANTTS